MTPSFKGMSGAQDPGHAGHEQMPVATDGGQRDHAVALALSGAPSAARARAGAAPRSAGLNGSALGALARRVRMTIEEDEDLDDDAPIVPPRTGAAMEDPAPRGVANDSSEASGLRLDARGGGSAGGGPGGAESRPAGPEATHGAVRVTAVDAATAPIAAVGPAAAPHRAEPPRDSALLRIAAWGVVLAALTALVSALWLVFESPEPATGERGAGAACDPSREGCAR